MTKMKKVFKIFLVLAIMACMFPVSISAEEPEDTPDFRTSFSII